MRQPGKILDGKYQISGIVGRGGFGYVYLARERLTGEVVAIKELIPSFVDDPEMVHRFIQEARATLRLKHRYIARTYGIFQDQGTYYLAMEHLPGGSLEERLEDGPLPPHQVVRIAADLCEALHYAHQKGVVHCDIKPANVLFDEDGQVQLVDFGIAYVSTDMMTRRFHTAAGLAMGTVQYMAPEQLSGVRDDPRIDVYAVGVLLYRMLAGKPYLAFRTETTPAAQAHNIGLIQQSQPRSLTDVRTDVPEHLAAVVHRALHKDPKGRFPSAEAMRDALQRRQSGRQGRKTIRARDDGGSARERASSRETPGRGIGPAAEGDRRGVDEADLDLRRVSQQSGRGPTDGAPPGSGSQQRRSTPGGIPLIAWALGGLALAVLTAAVALGLVLAGQTGRSGDAVGELGRVSTAEATEGDSATREPSATGTPTRTVDPSPLPDENRADTPEPAGTEATPEVETQIRPTDGAMMILVPAGAFDMGTSREDIEHALAFCLELNDECQREVFEKEWPIHRVTLDSFWIDRTEVTNEQFATFLDQETNQAEDGTDWLEVESESALIEQAGDSFRAKAGYADHPVLEVTWHGAAAYCEWIGGRLPTEAEWEYAARGPEARVFPWGDTFDGQRLNFCDARCPSEWAAEDSDDGYAKTGPVGGYPGGASWCGALDMAGNVWEWVEDWYGDYREEADVNPTGPASGAQKVLRGGSWYDTEQFVRSAYRFQLDPKFGFTVAGFRCAKDVD